MLLHATLDRPSRFEVALRNQQKDLLHSEDLRSIICCSRLIKAFLINQALPSVRFSFGFNQRFDWSQNCTPWAVETRPAQAGQGNAGSPTITSRHSASPASPGPPQSPGLSPSPPSS